MIILRVLVATAIIATSLSFISSQASAEANFDSVLVHQPQAKWIDGHGTLSWKAQVINGTNDTAYFNLFVRILDTAGFELTYTGKLMQKQKPQSVKEYKGTFDVLPEYVSQFGSVEISMEKDDYSTLMAEDAKAKKKSAK